MFEVGWTEMLVIAIVMIVVVGPKDLPKMLRTFGRTTTKLRAMAGDFRKQFDEALKEAELDDVKGLVDDVRKLNPANEIKQALSPMQKAAADVRAGLDAAMKPPKPAAPAAVTGAAASTGAVTEAKAATPLDRPQTAGAKKFPEADPAPASSASRAATPLKKGTTGKTATPAARATPAKVASGPAAKSGAAKPAAPKPARKAATKGRAS